MKYHIYCDESGIVDETYMVLGGVMIKSDKVDLINKKFSSLRGLEFKNHEIKFEKLKSYKNSRFYLEIVDKILCNEDYDIHFRCTIFDKRQINHQKFNTNPNKKDVYEQGFYKFYYTLLNNQFLRENKDCSFITYLDERPLHAQTSVNIKSLKDALNAGSINKISFPTLEFIPSQKSNFVQLADLLCGAVNYDKNKKNSAKKYKPEFVENLKIKKNIRYLGENTFRSRLDWKVFPVDFDKSKKR
jgi:hypothetical protein